LPKSSFLDILNPIFKDLILNNNKDSKKSILASEVSKVYMKIDNAESVIALLETIPNQKTWNNITAVIFACLGVVWAIGFFGLYSFDFNIFFFLLSFITGFYYFYEKKNFLKYLKKDEKGELIRPWWLSWTSGIFVMVISITIVRGFLVEPFKIPTGSMIPTIMIGDVSLINKTYYDIKIPIIEKTIYHRKDLERGDIAVFRFPPTPSVYYIKRLVGIPGDVIKYNFLTKEFFINGKEITKTFEKEVIRDKTKILSYKEDLFGVVHDVELDASGNSVVIPQKNPDIKNCILNKIEITCKVPEKHYFAMGDNRDNSYDSRYWGFIPNDNIVGKAQILAFSYQNINQIGWLK
jgi:signal peptidase I